MACTDAALCLQLLGLLQVCNPLGNCYHNCWIYCCYSRIILSELPAIYTAALNSGNMLTDAAYIYTIVNTSFCWLHSGKLLVNLLTKLYPVILFYREQLILLIFSYLQILHMHVFEKVVSIA